MFVLEKSPKPSRDNLRRCHETHSWTGYSLARCSSAVQPPLHRTDILYRIGKSEQATGNGEGALVKTGFQTKIAKIQKKRCQLLLPPYCTIRGRDLRMFVILEEKGGNPLLNVVVGDFSAMKMLNDFYVKTIPLHHLSGRPSVQFSIVGVVFFDTPLRLFFLREQMIRKSECWGCF